MIKVYYNKLLTKLYTLLYVGNPQGNLLENNISEQEFNALRNIFRIEVWKKGTTLEDLAENAGKQKVVNYIKKHYVRKPVWDK